MTLTDQVVLLRRHVVQRVAAGIPVSRVCLEAGISRTWGAMVVAGIIMAASLDGFGMNWGGATWECGSCQ